MIRESGGLCRRHFWKKIPTLYENGVTTAANACGTQDGAAFVVLCAESYAEKKGWKPWLRYVDMVEVAGNPEMPPLLVNKALEKLFEKTGVHRKRLPPMNAMRHLR